MVSPKSSRQSKSPSGNDRTKKTSQPTRVPQHGVRRFGLSGEHVFLLLLAFRIANALTVKTFFQPDEYYQSLEPAWRLAFGPKSGAWITWEWRNQLRSSLHPVLFAGIYRVASIVSQLCNLTPEQRAAVLLAAPKVAQATFAVSLDFFTWRLAQRIYGPESVAAFTTLALTVLSPWQWFCSTRTLSNCIEAALTSAALFFWPWHWNYARTSNDDYGGGRGRVRKGDRELDILSPLSRLGEVPRLRTSLLLAAMATILRPTNILVWIPLSLHTLWKASRNEKKILIIEAICSGFVHKLLLFFFLSSPKCSYHSLGYLPKLTLPHRRSIVATTTALLDRWYYGIWTFPPFRFLHFNITKDLAVFYGTNRADYYLTEGLPLLLMAALPFGLVELYSSLTTSIRRSTDTTRNSGGWVRSTLAWVVVFVVGSLSLISHKEARFLYPLLPPLLLLAARPLSSFLGKRSIWRYILVVLVLGFNIGASYYTTQIHQRGVIDVVDYLRTQHEQSGGMPDNRTSVAFLMPCHSTPWRSHLIYPEVDAWALTCEPPIDVPASERADYVDEADIFYSSPLIWLKSSMEDIKSRFHDGRGDGSVAKMKYESQSRIEDGRVTGVGRSWPKYIVTFEALETTMRVFLRGSPYTLCKKFFNTQTHDDKRRKGDVLVWCRP
ncbi:hypothetical protein EJ08DRAFT_597430 [Tothia fuscella]|uniref:Mannosyltransferase n=1 Tax=Tothia fuscella TaxID=1048955 RepID=A0A9P4TUB0_9PEZI|nr:hypothetical protein EJ08DRAFT_597430 [Tothia fuscella]